MTEHRFRPEISPNDDDFEEITISNITQKDLFVTPFFDMLNCCYAKLSFF